ncbi:hypothetical protein QUB49_01090 [Microcoleus sp. AT9_B4]
MCIGYRFFISGPIDRVAGILDGFGHGYLEIVVTLVLDSVLLVWEMRFGRVLVRSSVKEEDLFKGRNSLAPAAVAVYSPACDRFDLDAGGLTSWEGCQIDS